MYTLRLYSLLILSTACGASAPRSISPATERAAIDAMLDDWHRAAAEGDTERYFGHFTEDGIFLGTDRTERWDLDAFRAYAREPFADGRGWVIRSVRRDVMFAPSGTVAWIDEDLDGERLGPARGSAVLIHDGERWRIAHYNLALTVPNERFEVVRCLLAEGAAEGCPPAEP
jgi:ketosteroid isomerase-like protein